MLAKASETVEATASYVSLPSLSETDTSSVFFLRGLYGFLVVFIYKKRHNIAVVPRFTALGL